MDSKELNLATIRIAGIYDDLTAGIFDKECKLLNLDIEKWEKQLETFQPDLLLVESAWSGKDSGWYRKVSMKSKELVGVVEWCKVREIPTVFWNKEDPLQFNVFIESEFIFDWVFTTDLDSIPLYKRILKHDRIGLLPFATSIHLFNPIEEFERKKAVSFAGTYFKNQKVRTREFEEIYSVLEKILPIYIYERNIYPGNPDYRFPEKYRKHILGSLPIEQVSMAYKKYLFSLTMNTIKDSSTMQARRAFELLSSNTLVISNRCTALKNFFGELITYYDTAPGLYDRIQYLSENEEYMRKLRLAGLRKVMDQHTYKKRLEYVCQKALNKEIGVKQDSVLVLSWVTNKEQLEYVYETYKRQTYKEKKLVLLVSGNGIGDSVVEGSDKVLPYKEECSTVTLGMAEYYAYFSPQNYYGENYLKDCMQATSYAGKPIIGKECYYCKGLLKTKKKNNDDTYKEVKSISLDRCIIAYKEAAQITVGQIITDQCDFFEDHFFSIDEYNFCEGFRGNVCDIVDDLKIDTGCDLEKIYQVADGLCADPSYYTIQTKVTGAELVAHMIYHKSIENEISKEIDKETEEGTIAFKDIKRTASAVYAVYRKVREYERENKLFVYYDGEITGTAYLKIAFFNSMQEVLVRYNVPPKSYKRFPIPEQAETFTIHLIVTPHSTVKIKEIFFNAMPESGILKRIEEDGK